LFKWFGVLSIAPSGAVWLGEASRGKLSISARRKRLSDDGTYAGIIRSGVPKKIKRVKVKHKILEALIKIAEKEEEGISQILGHALKQYLRKSTKKKRKRTRKQKSRRKR
jgi:hypothetical protein